MTPFTLTEGYITKAQLGLFSYMSHVLTIAPNVRWGDTIPSCHHACYALADVFPTVRVQTGYFGKGEPHSWLLFEPCPKAVHADYRARVIADMYPIACATPILVYTYFLTYWSKAYTEDAHVIEEVRRDDLFFDAHVAELASHFRLSKAA